MVHFKDFKSNFSRLISHSYVFCLMIILSTLSNKIANASEDANYCLAIRGNGHQVPAHWVASAKIIEKLGMPKSIAGGSSGAISTFLIESAEKNTFIANQKNEAQKRAMWGLLIKSLPNYFSILSTKLELPTAMMLGSLYTSDQEHFPEKLIEVLSKKDPNEIERLIQTYSNLINPEVLNGLKSNPSFFKELIKESVSQLGKFNAVTDQNIFFRPGVIDFKALALHIGDAADLIAGNSPKQVNDQLNGFLASCSDQSLDKPWQSLSKDCQDEFNLTVNNYLEIKQKPMKRIFETVGSSQNIKSFSTTAIIEGDSATKYKELLTSFYATSGKDSIVKEYTVEESDLKFGYWGDHNLLNKIESDFSNLNVDKKSSFFTALGEKSWFEVLSTSPAEPGLARFQPLISPSMTNSDLKTEVSQERERSHLVNDWSKLIYDENIISAGGWSDLHPTTLLKKSGVCDNIVYLTRSGGDSVFAQQIFMRLSGESKILTFWKDIRSFNSSGKLDLNDQESRSNWNQLYNWGNLKSSFHLSLQNANMVYCTDWDNLNILAKTEPGEQPNLVKLLVNSFTAPIYLSNTQSSFNDLVIEHFPEQTKVSESLVPGCFSKD